MNREEKAQVIEELVEKFNNNSNFYITDASGLSVSEVNEFRKLCFNKGIEYKVFKNTMIKKALGRMQTDYQPFVEEGVLRGFSGILFIDGNGSVPAKVIKEFRRKKKGEKPVLKGASIDTELFIGDDKLESLSSLKSREELIGNIVVLLQSPARNVIASLQSAPSKLAGIVKTLADKKE
jgi:large subunit ribosomal protein L10